MLRISSKHISFAVMLLPLCFTPNTGNAQKVKCSLAVPLVLRDKNTQEPLIAAEVRTDRQVIQSDESGVAILNGMCPQSNAHLHITLEGYKAIDETIVISNGDTVYLNMSPAAKDLKEVQVVGHKMEVATQNAQSTLSGTELRRLKGNNIAAMASSVAGVTMLQTGASIAKPVINGMSGNRILILNNGVRQEGQQWGAEHAPEIDGMNAGSITVVKGAEAVRYGRDAIGGVLVVNPEPLPYHFPGIHGTANLIGVSNGQRGTSGLMLNGALGNSQNWAWRLQSSVSQGGNYKTPDYYLDNTGTKELNYSAALGYSVHKWSMEGYYSHYRSEIGIFKGSHIGDTTDLKARIANGRPFDDGSFYYTIDAPRQIVQHDLAKLKAHYHLNEQWSMDAQYSLQYDRRQEYDIRRGGRTGIPSVDLQLYYQELNLDAAYTNGKKWRGNVGLNGSMAVNNNQPDLYTVPLIPNYDTRNLGAYALARYLGESFTLEGGLRYDYQLLNAAGYDASNHLYGGTHNYQNISASIGASYIPDNRWRLSTNAATAWRPPTVNELYSTGLHHGAAQYELGDSSLRAEQSVKWMNTIAFQNTRKNFSVELDAYVHYFDNYIYLNPSLTYFQSLRGAFPVFNYKSTNALFTGLDLTAKYDFSTQWIYSLKGSTIRARDISNDQYLPFIPSDRITHSIRYVIPHMSKPGPVYAELEHVAVARQTRYEANSDYEAPPKGYQLINLRAGLEWPVGKQTLSVDVSVNNLTNQLYKDYMNRFRYYAHDLGRSVELRVAYKF
ncbi:TonB-dependent receptor [Edaphocola flava]|uniref:TonB-dependent receptor n=1 Tax=Edaphocola flava TaxID=2499629 RepID=UPI00100AD292|nr:TonB-dependent receptor [Edaphocola flava]